MNEEEMTYAKAGVDIEKSEIAKKYLIDKLKHKRSGIGAPLIEIGHYAGLIDFGEYVIAITTDGVGTKLLVANELKKWNTVGIDCVAANVNDLYAMGVEPVAFVDYLAVEKLDNEFMAQIGEGLNKGAKLADISIVGGETAIVPELVKGFDLAGTCIGIAKKEEIITGRDIKIGDVILGLRSSGIHCNGLTLARRVVEKAGYSYHDPFPYDPDITIGEELLRPTKIYSEALKIARKCEVHGMAHISGGGLFNLQRLTSLGFQISDPIPPNDIFNFIEENGKISKYEMYKTFNMGMGFAIILPEEEVEEALKIARDSAKMVGRIVERGCRVGRLKMW
ncbi:MAG: phosphoribosylformylglycinamidine cyclo-ligase [Methanocellales archaeon]